MAPNRSSGMLAFPDFSGFTRSLVVWNLGVFFLLLLLHLAVPAVADHILYWLTLTPLLVGHGYAWQLVTYSFIHDGLLATALELLSIWFLGAFLEANHGHRWLAELYFVGVLAAAITVITIAFLAAGHGSLQTAGLSGAFGGIFAMLVAFGVLYGDMQFTLFPLPVTMKARYLAAIYMLFAFAELFGQSRIYALGQLGAALAGFLFVKAAPRRGFTAETGRRWYEMRNSYYRWKRRQAARKFEVYMRKQNRDVHFDSEGRYVDPDSGRSTTGKVGPQDATGRKADSRDPNDRRWMN